MKHKLSLLATGLFLSAALYAQNIVQIANTTENQPYKISFAKMIMGEDKYSKITLNAWKAFDDNRLDELAFILSDTVNVVLADGTYLRGREAFMKGLKEYRGGFASVASRVDACTTLKSGSDPLHDITTIWGQEVGTRKDGTVQKLSLHEVWFYNAEGKVTTFYQYAVPMNK